jgi:hypothetical protein
MTRMRFGALAAAALAAAGCAGLRAQQARAGAVKNAMDETVFPGSCRDIWPKVLQTLAANGFQLVGRDRELAGQPEQGAVGRFFSRGFQTVQTDDGNLETGTDANPELLRMVAVGKPSGEKGCRVRMNAYQGDAAQNPEREYRDYDLELAALARVAPDLAVKVEEAADAAAR